jgi:acyl-CoA synthetase (NDP forming)
VKLDALGLAHKSDLGAVRLGLGSDDDVRSATRALLDLAAGARLEMRGVLVEPMADPGLELIVGVRRDPLFGPAVLVGLGGVLAETIGDVAIRLAPVRAPEAAAMLDELRGAALLRGVRGRPPVDRHALVELLVRLGDLAAERPDIVEIDLNPVIAGPSGVVAVDALVVVEVQP